MITFRMKRNVAVALLAVFCAVCLISKADDALSVEEWISRLKKEAAELDVTIAGTDFEQIRMAAGICGGNHSGKAEKQKPDVATEAALEKLKRFIEGDGMVILRKWRKGEALSPEEQKYERIVQYLFLSMARKDHRDAKTRKLVLALTPEEVADAEAYTKKVETEGKSLLTQIYKQSGPKKLTAGDVETLRLYHMALNIRCVMGLDYIPVMLELGPIPRRTPTVGVEMPDFRLPTLESVLQRPTYTDIAPYKQNRERPMRPDGVVEILNALPAYEMNEAGKVVSTAARLEARPGEKEEDFVRLSKLRGKPVVLLVPDATDCFWPLAYHILEPLYQAYKNAAAFYIVNVTIHDLQMHPPDFFADSDGTAFGCWTSHPLTVEERARTAKNSCIAIPYVSAPWLLDDVAGTVNNDYFGLGGNAGFRILDAEGKLSEATGAAFKNVLWANELEWRLRDVLANGGKYDASRVNTLFDFLPAMNRESDQRLSITIPSAVVESAQEGVCVVMAKMTSGEKTYTLKISPTTRVTGKDGNPCSAAELKAGTKVSVRFWADTYYKPPFQRTFTKLSSEYRGPVGEFDLVTGDGLTVKGRTWDGYGYEWEGYNFNHLLDDPGKGGLTPRRVDVLPDAGLSAPIRIWFCGKVQSVDKSARLVTVVRPKPAPDEFKGYALWKKSPAAKLPPHVEARMRCVEAWVTAPGEVLVRKIKIDDAPEMFLNGKWNATIDDFNPGDSIGFEYSVLQEGAELIYPEQVRLSRLP